MAINNSGDASNKKLVRRNSEYTRIDPGPYIGIVKDNVDPARMGTIKVYIPSLSGEGEEGRTNELKTVKYLNPFYGAKSPLGVDPTSPAKHSATQHSYGMWFTPPDIDTRVMVIFVEGRESQGYWMGCVMEPLTNHMIPGIASSTNTFSPFSEGDDVITKENIYGTDDVPASEVNRSLFNAEVSGTGFEQKKPIHPFADTLQRQGLISDPVRGTTTSSARRESPSNVFGISTPGPVSRRSDDSKKTRIGPLDKIQEKILTREAGHQFVMDDGDEGRNNKLIRLRTGGGHQILMHDTENVIYIANATGNAWMEFSASGRIDVYSNDSINLRSSTDFNIHSDANINMYAKNRIKMRGNQGISLDGKDILGYADFDIKWQATDGFIRSRAAGNIASYAGMQQLHNAKGQTHINGSEVHFNSKKVTDEYTPQLNRTLYYDISGTGTAEEDVYDVIAIDKTNKIIRKDKGNKTMSGMGQIPTHEPAIHASKVVRFFGTSNLSNANVPGTAEFVANTNRNSPLDVIRIGQAQADLEVYLRDNFPNASQKVLQEEAKKFMDGYKDRFRIPANLNLSFLTTGVTEAVNQVTEAITGKAINLLKDQVFIKDGKVLTTTGDLGKTVQSVTSVFKDLSSGTITTKTLGDILGGTIKLPGGDIGITLPSNLKNVPGVDKVTSTVKTVVGGKTTAITQVTSAINNATKKVVGSVTKAVGKLFG